ncbi:2-oxoglutarate dehydrogenase E1 component [Bradymonas sediminis]|uniref:oxoglutarate dehydrogenase (succinyl-transferring) n=1 Tax=Bradymonas sediminis TaxID=1548548 RepID=A0A2Z4FMA4_9DELT|nr:2-oxoglutarate dehydrogenase E1 component [Bradymonas sediminis]AWV89886.1 2-oxoglutarate dehydrogenase E1 component [Bradymonas sediminis]TDP61986.1 2-oxoglutarate dehydrogenase E1 component [Bradymonas sediminis]
MTKASKKALPQSQANTTEFSGSNLPYIEQLYGQYLRDAASVDPSWLPIFAEYLDQMGAEDPRPNFKRRSLFRAGASASNGQSAVDDGIYTDRVQNTSVEAPGRTAGFAARVESLVRAYRLHGHLAAKIDPLGFERPAPPPELDPASYGFNSSDMDTPVRCKALFGDNQQTSLREVLAKLKSLYCDSIAVQYQNMPVSRSRIWLRDQIELNNYAPLDTAEQKRALRRLIEADAFESFLGKKYVGAKRFSVTGGDALIPMLDAMLNEFGELGVEEVIFGMAHRGRLNVLHNIMDKPAEMMLSEFEKNPVPMEFLGSSDVKYHMGYSSDFESATGKKIHLSLCFNPSHLEFVNPVVVGRARAKQHRKGEESAHQQIVPVLMHGDAAFAGQGIVTETLNMSQLDAYDVGGTIHIVINNQIGFTAEPSEARSTTYATDVAKMLSVPIFHVNGNDPDACVRVMKLAARYRQMFGEDVIIDLVCYREYGHNEGDEPRFTQPLMYQAVDKLKPVREIYADELIAKNILTAEEASAQFDARTEMYSKVFDKVHTAPEKTTVDTMNGLWKPYKGGDVAEDHDVDTTISKELLLELGETLSQVPDDFTPHRTLGRLLKSRVQMAKGEKPMDWGMGEALAFGSLLKENTSIRLSGQDCVRGTFSHRHAALRDINNGDQYWPARHIAEEQGEFQVYNSLLSESAVLGFEYGYSLDSPDALVMWEAQFGDFSNGAQVIMDQFISAGEDKWMRLSGLVMLLPHGYEGQGPEHSSARLERYLQMCAEDNMIVCNPTTPAQYFHMIRRQVLSPLRKPLIVMTPKSLLRLNEASSTVDELTSGGFQKIKGETSEKVDPAKVKRVLMCSGKVYYDLDEYRQANELHDTAIIRFEQLYPLRKEDIDAALAEFPNREKVCWVQEEPKNMGPWPYLFERFYDYDLLPIEYVGRVASASPATGSRDAHLIEQAALVEKAFKG